MPTMRIVPTQFALCHAAAPDIDDDGEVQRAGPRREIGETPLRQIPLLRQPENVPRTGAPRAAAKY